MPCINSKQMLESFKRTYNSHLLNIAEFAEQGIVLELEIVTHSIVIKAIWRFWHNDAYNAYTYIH